MVIQQEVSSLFKPTLASLRAALDNRPDDAESHHALGSRLARRGEHADALRCLRRALQLGRETPELFDDVAQCLLGCGRVLDAVATYEEALRADAGWAAGYRRLGLLFRDRLDDSLAAGESFRRAAELEPERIDNWVGLASCYADGRTGREAMREVRRRVAGVHEPVLTKAVARALARTGRYPEAIKIVRDLLPKHADDFETSGLLADLCQAVHDWKTATEYHDRALKLNPAHAINCFYYWIKISDTARAVTTLKLRSDNELLRWGPPDEYLYPRWKGSPLQGRRVLFHAADFGTGDALQFCRLSKLFQDRGAVVFTECSLSCTSLIATVPGTEAAFGRFEQAPEIHFEFDAFYDLCFFLGEMPSSMGRLVPYFFPQPSRIEAFRRFLRPGRHLKVGVNWAGSRWWMEDKYSCRSMPARLLSSLAGVPGVEFYSLQKGPGAEDLKNGDVPLPLIDLGRHCRTFEDTAAAMQNLDAIVSVDTSVAHLAGGLGIPVLLLLPFNACFRWGIDRQDCDWYPSMRLFRQNQPGCWEEPVIQVAEALRELVAVRTGSASAAAGHTS